MDDADRAQIQADFHLRTTLARCRAHAGSESRSHCIDCGEPIPEARRRAAPGCERCVGCQEISEQEGKR